VMLCFITVVSMFLLSPLPAMPLMARNGKCRLLSAGLDTGARRRCSVAE
jgi:hypothetical protein